LDQLVGLGTADSAVLAAELLPSYAERLEEAIFANVIAITLGIAALIHSNSHITDAKETLRAEIKAEIAILRGEMGTIRGEMAELRAHIDAGFDRLENALKLHELEHHK